MQTTDRFGGRTAPTGAFADYVTAREEAGTLSPSVLITAGSYSLPPLHWAAVLSRACAVSFLLSRDFKATDRVPDTGHTPLHTMVLYGPMARWQPKDGINAFQRVLPLLVGTIGELDNNLSTPLHLAASKLDNGIGRRPIGRRPWKLLQTQYLGIFNCLMKSLALKSVEKRELLAKQDKNGNTVLHILAGKPKISCHTIRSLRRTGQ